MMRSGGTGDGRWLWVVSLIPVVFWGASLWYGHARPEHFFELVDEGGPIEDLQVYMYAAGALVGGYLAWRIWGRGQRSWAVAYGLLALGLVWMAGEEISWGQRALGFEPSAWFKAHNVQQETNLHNLPGVARFLRWGLDYVLGALSLLSFAAWRRGRDRLGRWRIDYWLPHHAFIPSWLCVIAYRQLRNIYHWLHPDTTSPSSYIQRTSEISELIFAAAVLVFLLTVVERIRQSAGSSQ